MEPGRTRREHQHRMDRRTKHWKGMIHKEKEQLTPIRADQVVAAEPTGLQLQFSQIHFRNGDQVVTVVVEEKEAQQYSGGNNQSCSSHREKRERQGHEEESEPQAIEIHSPLEYGHEHVHKPSLPEENHV